MKVFLSWSGPLSLKVACAFRDWLPSVIQSVKPYVSSEDIDKGARWSTDIAQELKESSFGILCITKDNLSAPWINFEAGALSKTFDKSRVCPFLFNIKRSEVQGPLLQFQSALCERDEIEKLLHSINASLPEDEKLEEGRIKKVFEVWWPELKHQLEKLRKDEAGEPQPKPEIQKEVTHAILEELLELARNQTKLLRSPPDLFPPEYVTSVLGRAVRASDIEDPELRDALDFLVRRTHELQQVLESLIKAPESARADSEEFARLRICVDRLADVVRYVTRVFARPRLPRSR